MILKKKFIFKIYFINCNSNKFVCEYFHDAKLAYHLKQSIIKTLVSKNLLNNFFQKILMR